MTEKLGPCPLCGGEPSLRIPGYASCVDDRCPMPQANEEAWNRLSAVAADARRVEELLRENIQLRLEQSAQVVDTSEYRDLMEDRQKQVVTVFRLRSALERCRELALGCGLREHVATVCDKALKGGEG